MTQPVPVTRMGTAARLGLVADTHCHAPGASDLPGSVLDAFRGVDLVVHLGDMGDAAVLDRLEGVGSAVATRGQDDPPDDHRIAPTVRVIEGGGLVVGALFDLTRAGLASREDSRPRFPADRPDEVLQSLFGRRVDVVAFGGTHQPMVAHHRGVLFVNPGSATFPARPAPDGHRTVAVLELRGGTATVEIVRI